MILSVLLVPGRAPGSLLRAVLAGGAGAGAGASPPRGGLARAPGLPHRLGLGARPLPPPPVAAAAQVPAEAGQAPAGRLGLGRERARAAFRAARVLLPQRARPRGRVALPPHPRGPRGPGRPLVLGVLVLLVRVLVLRLVPPRPDGGDLAALPPLGPSEAGVFLLGESESRG